MDVNTSLTIVTVIVGIVFLVAWYMHARLEKSDDPERDKMTFDVFYEIMKVVLSDLVKEGSYEGTYGPDYIAAVNRRRKLQTALRECVYAIESAKIVVISQIKRILEGLCETFNDLIEVFNFYADYIDPQKKFEILLYFYKQDYGRDALTQIIREYNLDRGRYIIEDGTIKSYIITADDIHDIYEQRIMSYQEMLEDDEKEAEIQRRSKNGLIQMSFGDTDNEKYGEDKDGKRIRIAKYKLDKASMSDLISLFAYQRYKGLGIIDTLQEMDINGFSIGCSGSVLSQLIPGRAGQEWTSSKSVWLYFQGKEIHLSFLSFGSEDELYRIVSLIGRYGRGHPLTEKMPYKISSMANQSRVLSIRPPMGESPAAFVRKFTLPRVDLEYLLKPKHPITGEELVFNAELVIGLIKFMMAGQLTAVITGRQGSGKTTNMMGWIKYIPATLTIRTIETVFEIRARELYPNRNIFAVQGTETIPTKEGQDALKKSNAAVTMVGEIATDEMASQYIQNIHISSPFSIATHHGMTERGTMEGLGNSHSANMNMPTQLAIMQVVSAVPMNAHLNIIDYKDVQVRYFERFSEIVPVTEKKKLPEVSGNTLEELQMSKIKFDYEVKLRELDPDLFKVNRIVYFDTNDMTYKADNWFTERITMHMYDRMPYEMRGEFVEFIKENWSSKLA